MIWLILCWGGGMGILIRYLYKHFICHLKMVVYQDYHLLFYHRYQKLSTQWQAQQIEQVKCGSILAYFLFFALSFALIFSLIDFPALAITYCLFISLICAISLIDWRYQLISTMLCNSLIWLALLTAWLGFSHRSLEQTLTSIVIGFNVFFILYYLAKWLYKREALGRGDYWLVAGLAGFLPWQQLPLFFFLASLFGLCYVGYQYLNGDKLAVIPFAPFLSLSAAILFFTECMNNV